MNDWHPEYSRVKTFCFLGSYVPRQCGLATFTKDLRDSVAAVLGAERSRVVAIDDVLEGYSYPEEVLFEVQAERASEYQTTADLINVHQVDVVALQHEYGIFGGANGSHIIELLRRLRMPLLTTLHTVLSEPSAGQRSTLETVIRLSDRVIVMNRRAKKLLEEVHGAPAEKVLFIPHGIPDVPFVDPNFYKDQFGVEGRTVLLTFGLLSPGKGIEVAIRAMPRIIERHPNTVYHVLGATHPHVLKREGDAYRCSLQELVRKLGVDAHVSFHDRFVSPDELRGYIGSADIYITPYSSREQITSGTLAYALGAGKAVVSTPYLYAEEMLADGRGRLFPFGDSERLAEAVIDLLDNEAERHTMRKRAYMHCRPMVWSAVAREYLRIAEEVVTERARSPRPLFRSTPPGGPVVPPRPDLSHLRRLTDGTGILQHAKYSVPNREHGYCTDDNARALVAVLRYHALTGDSSALRLADTYLAFLHHAFHAEKCRFRNFMGYDRQWLEEVGSEDGHGRALWALGIATELAPNDAVLSFATRLFGAALDGTYSLEAPRALAFCLIGIHAYLRRFSGDTRARRARAFLAERLLEAFRAHATDEWPWCEDVVTYSNARLPHALILAGKGLLHAELTRQGLRSLEWLVGLQLSKDGTVRLIGNRGWLERSGRRARFDQQPVEAMTLIEAASDAYRCTRNRIWIERAHRFLGWFTGNNETRSAIYDTQTGGCRDGLHPHGPNLNQGAESTLSWLLSVLSVLELETHAGKDTVTRRGEPEFLLAGPEQSTG